MIPALFASRSGEHEARRLANAAIGIAGAIGAFGRGAGQRRLPAVVLATKTGNAAYIGFIAFYVACAAVTWAVYLRRAHRLAGM